MATRRPELDALKAELAQSSPEPAPAAAHSKSRSRAKPAAAAASAHGTQPHVSHDAEPVEEAVASEAPEPSLSDLQALVRELQEAVSDAKAQADATVSAHPAVSVASAFLLGVLVGRAWGRSS
ncbi:hypothetical protein V5F77_02040 [Xanthobacter sp. DSM 24535]|uniref:hypothetical protein n=1 Tax=Roseixanthobacter psychrophilus TaxID=3119917 RepID=UPI00372C83F1